MCMQIRIFPADNSQFLQLFRIFVYFLADPEISTRIKNKEKLKLNSIGSQFIS